jgi:hypothetical protein
MNKAVETGTKVWLVVCMAEEVVEYSIDAFDTKHGAEQFIQHLLDTDFSDRIAIVRDGDILIYNQFLEGGITETNKQIYLDSGEWQWCINLRETKVSHCDELSVSDTTFVLD